MESIIRKVSDIDADQRKWLESNLGEQLKDSQQIIIRVVTIGSEPSAAARDNALSDLKSLAEKGSQHREDLRVSEQEADDVLDEAMDHTRRSDHS